MRLLQESRRNTSITTTSGGKPDGTGGLATAARGARSTLAYGSRSTATAETNHHPSRDLSTNQRSPRHTPTNTSDVGLASHTNPSAPTATDKR